MQKLLEASDRKKGDTCAKKKDRPDKRRNLILFQQWPAEYLYSGRISHPLGCWTLETKLLSSYVVYSSAYM